MSPPTGTTQHRHALVAGGVCVLELAALSLVWFTRSVAPAAPRTGGEPPTAAAVVAARRAPVSSLSALLTESSRQQTDDVRVALGRKMFFDPKLSEPEGMSCASCHDPAHGYAGNNGSKSGVAQGSRPGHFAHRSTPSVLYLRFVRRFHLEWEEEAELPEAFGGFFWDGRADTVAKVAPQPLLNPDEMGNRDARQISEKLAAAPYASELASEFDNVLESPDKAVEALGFCLEAFLTSREMSPFSAKYDEYLRGHVELTPLEARGLALFDDRSSAACSSCHKFDAHSRMPEASLFTDYGYDTVAVPRNHALAGNRDAQHFDLGVCERKDPRLHTEDPWFCGSFRTPSLRNVATRPSYMHNGVFSNLRDVVTFYATRGSDPKRWYKSGELDDLPEKYRQYVNVNVPPYNGVQGQAPALGERDIDALVAFLETLTDASVPRGP